MRHGRTASNLQRVFLGRTDVPMDPLGVRQAGLVAAALAAEPHPDALLTSPLDRARATARLIADRIGVEPVVVPGLIEMDFGELEATPFDRLLRDYPDLARRLMAADAPDAGWPGGETAAGFHRRVRATFDAILRDHPHESVIVVSHGGVLGSFLAQIQGRSPNEAAAYQVANCSVTKLVVTRDHTAIHRLNDVAHLACLAAEPTKEE